MSSAILVSSSFFVRTSTLQKLQKQCFVSSKKKLINGYFFIDNDFIINFHDTSSEIICKSASGFLIICNTSGLSPKEALNLVTTTLLSTFVMASSKIYCSSLSLSSLSLKESVLVFLSHSNLLSQNRHFLIL